MHDDRNRIRHVAGSAAALAKGAQVSAIVEGEDAHAMVPRVADEDLTFVHREATGLIEFTARAPVVPLRFLVVRVGTRDVADELQASLIEDADAIVARLGDK